MSVPRDKMKEDIHASMEECPKEPAARVKFTMAVVSSFLAHYVAHFEKPPTEKMPISLNGADVNELLHLWTALMVFGERLPSMSFDNNAIKYPTWYSTQIEKELGSFGWRYSRTSLYETVFKYHLTDDMIMLEKDPLIYYQKLREKPLKKFLNGELFPEGEPQRVKYAMAMAGSVLVKLKAPPTAAHPIYLRGNHYLQLRYVWTAFMVYGQHLPQMKFGSEAIKIESNAFSTKDDLTWGWSLSWLWTQTPPFFSSSSLYETVFKPRLPSTITYPIAKLNTFLI